jgi:beta-xylosidase
MKYFIFHVALAMLMINMPARAWLADNGNGTFTNPLFYDEFSDPDLIRVGDDFYFTGTTMHTMPGLPVLHSKDLVNWELLGYACDKLDLGSEFRLEDGKEIYGQGIWAPSFRYHNGKFYIFSNVNHRKTQLFAATNPAGPWTHTELNRSFHDLSVLFDDDGKVYVVWGYQDIHFAQFTDDLKDIVPGTERALFSKTAGMGEGSHFYKINGKYFITSACFAGRMRMACARADKPEGPYEVNQAISKDEDFGLNQGWRLRNDRKGPPFDTIPANTRDDGRMSLHQGGLVQTPTGEWWGFSMMDYNSVGRLTCLSPITWTNGWPYFGLPGNLGRTPRTWVKPNTGHTSKPATPYQRDDDFYGPKLASVWQWNHVPDDSKWSLTERKGFLRLHALPATNFWFARNTLTQRAIGPESTPTAELDASGMKPGDVAGLALLNFPYAWIGVRCETNAMKLEQFNQLAGETSSVPLTTNRVSLRAQCDFITEKAAFSYSTDGKMFTPLGGELTMIFQGKTFQGVRYSLFNYNDSGAADGYADFDKFTVDESHPRGFTRPIPAGNIITLENMADGAVLVSKDDGLDSVAAGDSVAHSSAAQFKVLDRKLGRVALQSVGDGRLVTVTGLGEKGRVSLERDHGDASQSFQWTEMPRGDLLLLSVTSNRHLRINSDQNTVTADAPGATADRKCGSSLAWRIIATANEKHTINPH